MDIGKVIKNQRQKRNMTQAELAALLNITPQAVSRWKMNISYPDIAMLPKLSEVLCVTTDELLGIGLRQWGWRTGEDVDAVLNQSQADSIFNYMPGPATGRGRKILVVDDSEYMRAVLEDMLTQQGHNVLQARDGQECLDVLGCEAVDICLLDIVMPVMDGITALGKIKEMLPELRVVMLSALSQESNVRLALALGADAFVVKPFQAQCLIERIG